MGGGRHRGGANMRPHDPSPFDEPPSDGLVVVFWTLVVMTIFLLVVIVGASLYREGWL